MSTLPSPSSGASSPRSGIHPGVIALIAAAVALCGFAVWSMARKDAAPEPVAQGVAGPSMSAESSMRSPMAEPSGGGQAARAAHTPAPAHLAANAPAVCHDCGRIESITVTEHEGQGTGLGAVAGGVLGGVLGHQFGGGSGRDVATVVGAAGGAYAGHQVEKKARSVKTWNINVRMNDGTVRTVHQSTQPTWQAGEPVRVVNGQVVAATAGPANGG